jgi:hypothetical protein
MLEDIDEGGDGLIDAVEMVRLVKQKIEVM